jgi:hypothetical protein
VDGGQEVSTFEGGAAPETNISSVQSVQFAGQLS